MKAVIDQNITNDTILMKIGNSFVNFTHTIGRGDATGRKTPKISEQLDAPADHDDLSARLQFDRVQNNIRVVNHERALAQPSADGPILSGP